MNFDGGCVTCETSPVAESRDGAGREVLLATAAYEGWMDSCAGYASGCECLMRSSGASARRGSRESAIAVACGTRRRSGRCRDGARLERFNHLAAQTG